MQGLHLIAKVERAGAGQTPIFDEPEGVREVEEDISVQTRPNVDVDVQNLNNSLAEVQVWFGGSSVDPDDVCQAADVVRDVAAGGFLASQTVSNMTLRFRR